MSDLLKDKLSFNGELSREIALSIMTKCLVAAVSTQNECWNNEEYMQGVGKSYDRIQEMRDQLEQQGDEMCGVQKIAEAINLLRTIFITKKLPDEEQSEWINEILNGLNISELSL